MTRIAAILIRALILVLQTLPLRWVAAVGRLGGRLAWFLSGRHRRLALHNLGLAFPEKSRPDLVAIARENMKRLGENYASAVKTSSMPPEDLLRVCPVIGLEKLRPLEGSGRNGIVAIGHFGNFEIYTILGQLVSGMVGATTYRGLNQPAFNEILVALRKRTGCRYYERRTDAAELKAALASGGVLLGLLSDQYAGRRGVEGTFFNHPAFTTPSPAILALRYRAPLYTAICFRVSLGRWQIEIGDEIPTRNNGKPRRAAEIMADVNAAFEKAIRRDPANWFWVHNRWKAPGRKQVFPE